MTVLSIAHRLTTLKNSDQVLVMDQGLSYRRKLPGASGEGGIFRDMYYGKLK